MQFSTLVLATLSASLASAAPRPQDPSSTCEYPFNYNLSQFKPTILQTFSYDGKQVVNTETSSNTIVVEKLPLLKPGQTVTVKFNTNKGYKFIPDTVTFSGDDQTTSVNVLLYPSDPVNLSHEDVEVMVDASMTNYPCQVQVDAGRFISPVIRQAIM